MSVRITDDHAARLAKMAPALIAPAIAHELEASAGLIVEDAKASLEEGAIRGPGHVPSTAPDPPNSDTGALHDSGHVNEAVEIGDTITASAAFGTDYAAAQELGNSRLPERPFLGPATRRAHDDVIRSLAQRLRDERA